MEPRSGRKHRAGHRLAAFLFSGIFIFGLQDVAAANDFDGSTYARNVSLHTSVDIFWTIDSEAETIRVAVHSKSASGWVGVGISEMGGMEGADILYYETATGNLTDAHSLVAGTPVIDECSQDWTLLSAEIGNGSLVFEAERALDTGDVQDRVFVDDSAEGSVPTRLIVAWGNESVSYHDADFAKGEVVMFGGAETAAAAEPLLEIKANADVLFFDVTTEEFSIPTGRTWYEDTCISASVLPDLDEYHAIGFEGLIQDENAEFVHHLVLTGYYGPPDCGQACYEWVEETFGTIESEDSDDGSGTSGTAPSSSSSPSSAIERLNLTVPWFCIGVEDTADVFTWAPGVNNMELPDDVGFRMGNATGGFNSLSLSTHYNNPDGVTGRNDSSGLRVYYTEEMRPMDMGVLRLGDPFVALAGNAVPDGKSVISFGCPGSCTEAHFEEEEVTVFAHFLHMHENGQRLQTRHYRNDSAGNEVLLRTADIEYYSFVQAGGYMLTVNDSVIIKRGDRFETTCYYDTDLSSVGSDNVTYGLGSEQEMCMDFVYYYPDQRIPSVGSCGLLACGGDILVESELEADSDFERTFGIVDTCIASEEGVESSSTSRATVPGLGLLVFSMTVALALAGIVPLPRERLAGAQPSEFAPGCDADLIHVQ